MEGTDFIAAFSTEGWVAFSTRLNRIPYVDGMHGHVFHFHSQVMPEDERLSLGLTVINKETGRTEEPVIPVRSVQIVHFAGVRGDPSCPRCRRSDDEVVLEEER